jgi:hypothetical protein
MCLACCESKYVLAIPPFLINLDIPVKREPYINEPLNDKHMALAPPNSYRFFL